MNGNQNIRIECMHDKKPHTQTRWMREKSEYLFADFIPFFSRALDFSHIFSFPLESLSGKVFSLAGDRQTSFHFHSDDLIRRCEYRWCFALDAYIDAAVNIASLYGSCQIRNRSTIWLTGSNFNREYSKFLSFRRSMLIRLFVQQWEEEGSVNSRKH